MLLCGKNSFEDQHCRTYPNSRTFRRMCTSKSLRTSMPCSFVRPSVRVYSPACLCRCLGPVHRWDRTECRGGRSSKRPTQFQAGSQLLLVLRRSAKNERRTSGVCVVCGGRLRVCTSWSGPWSPGSPLQLAREGESREVRTVVGGVNWRHQRERDNRRCEVRLPRIREIVTRLSDSGSYLSGAKRFRRSGCRYTRSRVSSLGCYILGVG